MAKHIHIHLSSATRDAEGTKHDPKNGQFTAGAGGSGLHAKRLPVGSHVTHKSGAYAGKVTGHEGEHVHVEKDGATRKLLGGMLAPDYARHIDPKSAAAAYKGTHAGPLHIGSTGQEGASAHKLLNPGTAKLMNPGQKALSGVKSVPTKALPKKA